MSTASVAKRYEYRMIPYMNKTKKHERVSKTKTRYWGWLREKFGDQKLIKWVSFFDAGKFATDTWISMMAAWKIMQWLNSAKKIAQFVAKYPKRASYLKPAAEWLAFTEASTITWRWQLATPLETAIWVAAWPALKWIWELWKLWVKAIPKLASKIELSWIINPQKLDTVRKQLITEWVKEAEAMDVWKWMLDRWIKWNKTQIVNQLRDVASKTFKNVDKTLAKSKALYKNKTANTLLNYLKQEYKWSLSADRKELYKQIVSLANKSKSKWLNLAEVNKVKRMIWDLDTFTSTWKVKLAKADLVSANRELKEFIEKEAKRTIKWVGKNTIKMMNNEIQVANWLAEWIARKESTAASMEVVNFLAWRTPWAVVGWYIWYQKGWDWRSTIMWAVIWWALWSTKIKTNLANYHTNLSIQQKRHCCRSSSKRNEQQTYTTDRIKAQ